MILKFEKIIVHNFSCYQDAELTLNDMGYTIVSGRNNNSSDNAISNGSGKSSIFNAISYAITGETTQGLSNNVENIYSNPNDCWVELHFTADEDYFIIRRYKTPKTDLKIYINGEDRSGKGIKESQKILEGYLPDITSRLLGSIILLGQGLPYRFTVNTPSQRKHLLEKLTKSDYMVQTVKDKLELRKEELKSILRNFEDRDIANKTELKLHYNTLNKIKLEIQEYEDISSEGSLEDKLVDIKECINTYNETLKQLNTEKEDIDSTRDMLLQQKSAIASTDSEKLNSKLVNVNLDIDKWFKQLADKNASIKTLKNEIKKLESVKDTCPTCGQKLINVKMVDTSNLKTQLAIMEQELTDIQATYDVNVDFKNKIIQSHNDAMAVEYKTIDSNVQELLKKSSLIKNKITTITDNVQRLITEEARLQNIQINYSKLVDDRDELSEKISTLALEQDSIATNIRDTNNHLRVVQDLITLAKREFRSVLLENIIRYLDKKAKQYSVEVFGAELITIKTDENYIDVIFSGKYYEALSGGEKQKVDVIIQLALRDLLSTQLNIKSNILVLDEVLDFLDEKGADSILKLIQNYTTDIDSIFMISHRVEKLNISYDTIIEVMKDSNNISTIFVR